MKPSKKRKLKPTRKGMENVLDFGREYALQPYKVNKLYRPVFGTEYRCRLVYYERGYSINPGLGGTAATHVFSCNGLYDPDISGAGHQPSGFDSLTGFFDHYTVLSGRIYVTFHNSDTTYHQNVGIYLADFTTAETDARVIIENGKGVMTKLAPAGQDAAQCQLSMPISISKFLGRPDPLSEDDLRGTVATNPAEQAYYHVWCSPTSGVDSSAVGFEVRIEYYAVWTEPKNMVIS